MRKIAAVSFLGLLGLLAPMIEQLPAEAHGTNDWVYIYNPFIDDDDAHDDVSAWWPWGAEVAPASHHIVYSNFDNNYPNDFAMDC